MKKIIKKLFPERIKIILRRVENFFDRLNYAFTKPMILNDNFGNNIVLYPEMTPSIRCIASNGYYLSEFIVMNMLVKKGDITLDVGANVGAISLYLSHIVSDDGRVYAFEPLPETFRRLEETVALNKIGNIKCFQAAMSDASGEAEFYYYNDMQNSQFNSLGQVHSGKQAFNKTMKVQTISIDDFCYKEGIRHIDFLKIDVEGFELDVLKGAEKCLNSKSIDSIQFEVSEILLSNIGKKTGDILEYLGSKTYSVYEFDTSTGKFTAPIIKFDKRHANYYASHNDLRLINNQPLIV